MLSQDILAMDSAPAVKLEERRSTRFSTELQAMVRIRDSEEAAWKEQTIVQTVSKSGAGFRLSRECEIGRLVTMVLDMPREFRAYDLDEIVYGVLGLVQHCTPVVEDGETYYNIGVAFVGRRVPESYKSNPTQCYHVCGMTREGLWQIVESETPFRVRKHTRHWINLDATITLIKKGQHNGEKVEVVTREISACGASVFSDLEAQPGDKVKFACPEFNFYTIAIVRNCRERMGIPFMLHLEFVDTMFPMQKMLEAQHRPAAPASPAETKTASKKNN